MEQPAKPVKSPREVASEWYERCSTVAVGHYKTAERYAGRHAKLSGWSAILSAVVGTAVFGSLQQQPQLALKIVVGLLSLFAAVLATLSSAMSFQDKAEKHRIAGSKYNAVGRELEQMLAQTTVESSALTGIRTRLDNLAQEAPHIPRTVHDELSDFATISKWGRPPLLARLKRRWRGDA